MPSRIAPASAKALLLAACLAGPPAPSAAGESRLVEILDTNRPAEVVLATEVGDADLQDPRGYANPGAQRHFVGRRIILENAGTTPLEDLELIVNGRDWTSLERILPGQGIPPPARVPALDLFDFWTAHRFHASAGRPEAEDAATMFRLWGYTLCGEDTAALAGLLHGRGIPARTVALKGHVTGEYFFSGKWNVLDGDQNVYYLMLDNAALASAEEIRRDPLLALRTKPFGRYAERSLPHAYFNAALFNYIKPKATKPILRPKPAAAGPGHSEMLLPGERVTLHLDRAPLQPAGRTNLAAWPGAREHGLALLEYGLRPSARQQPEAGSVFRTRHPIVEESADSSRQEDLRFEQVLPASTASGEVAIFAQRSRVSMPRFNPGTNTVLARANGPGRVRLIVEFEPLSVPLPQVSVSGPAEKQHGALTFDVAADPQVDRLWWQISDTFAFERVHPSFDHVQDFRKRLRVDALSATFLQGGTPYFIRARGRRDGVWGKWSAPADFRVAKPPQPVNLQLSRDGAGGHLLRWEGAAGCEYLVFASDRLDFLPEIYTAEEPVSMRRFAIEKTRPNQNLVATVRETAVELPGLRAFYRVIAMKDGKPSIPSPLLHAPAGLLPPGHPRKVLQMEASDARGDETPDYRAKEVLLPPAP